jgi:hypothetical protein
VKEVGAHSERGFLARFVFDNYPLKLLSLGLSVALFSLVHSDLDAQRSMYLDVVALLPPRKSDKMLVSPLPAQVKVTLRGSRARVAALQHDDFGPLQMDLRDTSRRYYYFDQGAIDVSGAVQVVSIEPASVELVWQPRAERKLPVKVKLRGSPQDGYVVRRPISVAPNVVSLSGPKAELDALAEVETDEIAIDGLGEGVHERRTQLQPLPAHLNYSDANSVLVQLEIGAEQGERTLRRLDVAVLGPGDAALRPGAVAITLQGSVRGLAELEPEQVVPYVELPAAPANPGVEVLEVKVRGVPDSVSVARVVPSSVIAKRR